MSASKVVLNILHVCISILVFLLVLFGLMKLGTAAYDMGYRVFTEKPMENEPGTDVVVEIRQGMDAGSIGTVLEEKRLIRDARVFVIQMQISAFGKKVKPGRYTLNTSQTAREMLEIMTAEEPKEEEEKDE